MKSLIEIEFDSIDTVFKNSERLPELLANILDPNGVDSVSMKLKGKRVLQFNRRHGLVDTLKELYQSYTDGCDLTRCSYEDGLWKEVAETLDLTQDTSEKEVEKC